MHKVIHSTCVASESIMFQRSCLLCRSKPVDKFNCTSLIIACCDSGRKCKATMPLLVYVCFYKNVHKKARGVINIVVHGTRVVVRSTLFEKSCLLSNMNDAVCVVNNYHVE